jgi:Ser/Thr protein kinase RdoA (MazF antagonist)
MLSALQRRALVAARAVATARGLRADAAAVIHSGSNVLVHLRPAPVVARVMTGTVALHDDPQTWLERELSVLEFLAPSGVAVAPSRLISPGPHCHDGLWMTFTEWIADVEPILAGESAANLGRASGLGAALRDLHDRLRPFAGELGDLRAVHGDIERLLGQLAPSDAKQDAAIASLREQLEMLRTVVFEACLPAQALHGDVSLRNLLRTPNRLVWNDFEDTFRGPVHWDVASYVGSLRIDGASEGAVQEMLAAYGWDDPRELSPFLAAQDVYDAIWRMYDQQRRGPPRPATD